MVYKKIDKASNDAIPNGLDLFSTPMTQVAIERTFEREYLPLNPVKQAPQQFKVLTGTSFMDAMKTRIYTQWRIMKKDKATSGNANPQGEGTTAVQNIGVVNGLGYVFPRNVRLLMQGQEVFHANNLYSYKAELDAEVGYSADAKSSSMNAFGYYYDDSGFVGEEKKATVNDKEEVIFKGLRGSKAFKERCNQFTSLQKVEYLAPLSIGLFQTNRYIPSMTELDFEFHPQDTKFLVVAPGYEGEVKLELVQMRLFVTFVELQPGVALDFEQRIEKEPARIPYRRADMRTVYLEAGRQDNHSNIFPDYVPRSLIMAPVDMENYHGHQGKDPFYYNHQNLLRNIHLQAGGLEVPYVPFELDFRVNEYVRAFDHLHRTLGLSGQNLDCGINRKMFKEGYTIFPFNLTTSQDDEEGFDFVREGPTMLHLRFHEPITGGMYWILYAEWDAMLYIDRTRVVRSDMAA